MDQWEITEELNEIAIALVLINQEVARWQRSALPFRSSETKPARLAFRVGLRPGEQPPAFFRAAAQEQFATERQIRIAVIGIERDGLPKALHRLVATSRAREHHARIIVPVGTLRQGLELGQRIFDPVL